ncbi:DsbA family protein [Sphingosinithalassobacter sp. LHW66-3]|uniref:DsbA family protein n=1 Tax=Sphingosinithalassobacter sp. LHW66-3 TaxID=3424718 RepID=UPI003D6A37AD
MIERLTRSPWLFAASFVLAAVLGAGIFAAAQAVVPAAGADADRARIELVVRDYLLENPEILPEAMERLRARETAGAVEANRNAIVDPYPGAWAGNPDGDVTVAVYMDYACGFCRASLPAIEELLTKDRNVRVVYREFPILSEQSVTAARWALAAAEQGKYSSFHDALFAQGQLSEASIRRAAATAGLNIEKVRETVGTPRVQRELATNHTTAQALGISGTPAWVIGDRVLPGAVSYRQLADAVAAARR